MQYRKIISAVNLPLKLIRATVVNADIGSLRSLHTFLIFFFFFFTHTSEIWTKSYGPNYTKFWAFRQKKKSLMQIINFKTTIFQCFKNDGSPAHVTWLKVSPNMAEPISIEDSDSRLESYVFFFFFETENTLLLLLLLNLEVILNVFFFFFFFFFFRKYMVNTYVVCNDRVSGCCKNELGSSYLL